jgi:hypothetical protein
MAAVVVGIRLQGPQRRKSKRNKIEMEEMRAE